MSSSPVTAEMLEKMPEDGKRYELIRGELISKGDCRTMSPSNPTHGYVGSLVITALTAHVVQQDLGRVFSLDTGFTLGRRPDTVLGPDIAFVRKDRLDQVTPTGFPSLAPDLAIEILSPSNTASEILHKIGIYLDAGVRAVWIIDPLNNRAEIHRRDSVERFESDGVLRDAELLPGFELPLSSILSRPDAPAD